MTQHIMENKEDDNDNVEIWELSDSKLNELFLLYKKSKTKCIDQCEKMGLSQQFTQNVIKHFQEKDGSIQ